MFFRTVHLAIALLAAASSAINVEVFSSESPEKASAEMIPLSLQEVHGSNRMKLTNKFILDNTAEQKTYVETYEVITKTHSGPLAKRASPPTNTSEGRERIDLTPAKCNRVCYSGSYEGPLQTDCDKIVAAQYKSTGSLTAYPGNYVLVYSGTCAVVFQNPTAKPEFSYTFDYNWALLGNIVVRLQDKCFSKEDSLSIGGACKINHYLKHTFHNVLISLQRYVPPQPPSKTLEARAT